MDTDLMIKIQELLHDASDEDKRVLETLVDGVIRKVKGETGSYLGGILHACHQRINEDEYEITIPNTELIQNGLQIVHGGITATLLDHTMGTFVHQFLPSNKGAVTTEMKINYVAPGIGKELRCIASIIHKGSKICVTEGKVFRDDGKLIAHATASFFIIDRKGA